MYVCICLAFRIESYFLSYLFVDLISICCLLYVTLLDIHDGMLKTKVLFGGFAYQRNVNVLLTFI